jgi:hypothetical protein
MNVEIGAEAPLFPEKEYISGIFVAVHPFKLASQVTDIPRTNDHS